MAVRATSGCRSTSRVLLVLGVNRFFLASLSAALPHVVAGDKLVMANSVSPTAGGTMAAIGGLVGLGVNAATGDTRARTRPSPCWSRACCYVAAGLVAHTMAPGLCSARRASRASASPGRIATELAVVAAGLVAGARYVLRRRGPAAALGRDRRRTGSSTGSCS